MFPQSTLTHITREMVGSTKRFVDPKLSTTITEEGKNTVPVNVGLGG